MKNLSKETKIRIKEEIDSIACKMILEKDPEELQKLSKRYQLLSNLIKIDWKIKPDTIAIISANLLGILLILNYERLDVVSTKALGFVSKIRV